MVCGVLSSRSAQLIVQHAVHCVGVLLSVISWFLLFIAFLSIRVSGVNSDLDIAVRASHGMCALFSLMFAFFSSAGELKQNHLLLCLSTGVHAYLFITGFTTASLGFLHFNFLVVPVESSAEQSFRLYETIGFLVQSDVNPLLVMSRYSCCGFHHADSLLPDRSQFFEPNNTMSDNFLKALPNACCRNRHPASHTLMQNLALRDGSCRLESEHRHQKNCSSVIEQFIVRDLHIMNALGLLLAALNGLNCYFTYVLSVNVRDVEA